MSEPLMRIRINTTVTDSVQQISSVGNVRKWVTCTYHHIEHIKSRPNHHKSCPNDEN